MFSLVADYGDSDEENNSSDSSAAASSAGSENPSDEEGHEQAVKKSEAPATLPSATSMFSNDKRIMPGGVFSNPFKEAEDAKMASLEKHVKMIDPEHEINEQKRKICWSYRKGRCRFGSQCNFAHDSDLILRKDMFGSTSAEDQETGEGEQVCDQKVGQNLLKKKPITLNNKKKRPGLSRELVPPKKVLKMYHREKISSGKP
ncbi:uncharacterized protein LOC129754705 [Uranotaenia lowii]|uniref:uncharacterized protein LOC129754705 n=1 Tax=Uranotaenia lowii TaxID=190385 RepID=UPI0024789E02|nr:uncharacterized protein LOC129754705 [Uranotaenia lowii]